jgi:hypothetical protein
MNRADGTWTKMAYSGSPILISNKLAYQDINQQPIIANQNQNTKPTFLLESNPHDTSPVRPGLPPPPPPAHCPFDAIHDAPVASSPKYSSVERFSIARNVMRDVSVKSSAPELHHIIVRVCGCTWTCDINSGVWLTYLRTRLFLSQF